MVAHELKLDPKYDHHDYPTTAPESQPGHPGHTTPEQDAQVYQLRTQLEREGYTERLDTLTLVRTVMEKALLHTALTIPTATILESAEVQCRGFTLDVSPSKGSEAELF